MTRSGIFIALLVPAVAGAWIEFRHLKSQLFASPGLVMPLVVGQKVIHFGFDEAPRTDGVPAPWQSKIIKGTMQVDLIDTPELSGKKAVRLQCEKSHFLIYNASSPFDPEQYPVLEWSWKVVTLPTDGDVRKHDPIPYIGENRNDAAVQILIGFEGNDVLSYIWDTTAPVGTEVEEPSPVAKVRTQVMDSGIAHLNEWITHRVNIVDDYRRRFGKSPGKVLGISIQTNSNHTASTCDGMVSEITAQSP